jgi:hypothetical protein
LVIITSQNSVGQAILVGPGRDDERRSRTTGSRVSNTFTLALTEVFNADQLPPVNAFWSLTMYELPKSLLVANPINRYLLNSPMLPQLKKDADGGLTFNLEIDVPVFHGSSSR